MNTFGMPIYLSVLVLLAGCASVEGRAFKAANKTNTVASWNKFLVNYPDSHLTTSAERNLSQAKKREYEQISTRAWVKSLASKSSDQIIKYFKDYPEALNDEKKIFDLLDKSSCCVLKKIFNIPTSSNTTAKRLYDEMNTGTGNSMSVRKKAKKMRFHQWVGKCKVIDVNPVGHSGVDCGNFGYVIKSYGTRIRSRYQVVLGKYTGTFLGVGSSFSHADRWLPSLHPKQVFAASSCACDGELALSSELKFGAASKNDVLNELDSPDKIEGNACCSVWTYLRPVWSDEYGFLRNGIRLGFDKEGILSSFEVVR